MKKIVRVILKSLPAPLEKYYFKRYFLNDHNKWLKKGSSIPPSHFSKQKSLIEIANRYKIKIFVETGTYFGDMLFALYDNFDSLYSIELSKELYQKAKKRFTRKPKIHLLNGDSGAKIGVIVTQLNKPALFWLDGHYSGGITAKGSKNCPIYEELDKIFISPINHVIIIDDARCFIGRDDYPTIETLSNYILQKKPFYQIEIKNDSIRLFP